MSVTAASQELPLYLQMSRYTKGSTAVMDLRRERFLAEQAEQSSTSTAIEISSDDQIITGSIDRSAGRDIAAQGAQEDGDEEAGFSFDDFLDTINPLQHLPVISTLYREMTGDEIGPTARIVGGAIFGGPIGAGIALADAVLEEVTGTDTGAHVMAWFDGGSPDNTQITNAAPPQPTPAHRETETALQNRTGQPNGNVVAVVRDQRASAPVPTPTPSLSPEAFRALLAPTKEEPEATIGRPQPVDISAAMSAALDRYATANSAQR